MNLLEQKIIRSINDEGPITFERFMDMALYDREYGYYMSGVRRIGREGDFYTSSHLHPVFGIMICRQIIEMWEFMGCPSDFTIIEMGAGEGYLCRDILDFLKGTGNDDRQKREAFLGSLRYLIIERSRFQREIQQERLAEHMENVEWADSLEPAGRFRGCIFSNELLDAFPVHMVRMDEELREIYIGHNGDKFIELDGPLSSSALSDYFLEYAPALERGYVTEANLCICDWIADAEAALQHGFIFTIDYGHPAEEYYSEDRNRGTLICYRKHQVSEDPYLYPGEQDITSHVNFSYLKRCGEDAGIRSIGYCSQGTFLIASGIDREIAGIAEKSDSYVFELARIKKLFLPQGLGDSHKVMIQYKGEGMPLLKGFSMRNQLRFL